MTATYISYRLFSQDFAKTTTRTYKVKAGDTLTRIAQKELGDGDRWREIFLLNRATIRDPDRIQLQPLLQSAGRRRACATRRRWRLPGAGSFRGTADRRGRA